MKRLVGLLVVVFLVIFAVPVNAAPPEQVYLLGSAAPLTQAQLAQLRQAGAQVIYAYGTFGGAAASIPAAKLNAVRALPFITSANKDSLKQLHRAPSQRAAASVLPGTPYWHDLIDAEKNATYTGSGVWVAVLDDGFYPNWRDFFNESSILTHLATAFIGPTANPNNNQWDAGSDPHGMAVAAEIIGYTLRDRAGEGGFGQGFATGAAGTYWVPGIAPGAKVIPVKVCQPRGCWQSAVSAGVDYITSLKRANPTQPIVINMSLGGSTLDPVEKAAIDAAVQAGVVMVASAGNEGDAGMGFPAAYEPVIAVGAGGWVGQWTNWPHNTWWLNDTPETGVDALFVASFSSRQKTGQYLDVVSAGSSMLLPYPCAHLVHNTPAADIAKCASKATPDSPQAAPFQYWYMSGTSMSSPALAGVVALMLHKNGSLSNADASLGALNNPASWGPGGLERLLESTATPMPGRSVTVTGRDGTLVTLTWGSDATGAGWVFVDKVLAAVR